MSSTHDRRTATSRSSSELPKPRPPFAADIDGERLQIESLGTMARKLYEAQDRDGIVIVDSAGREWTHDTFLAAVPVAEGQRREVDEPDEDEESGHGSRRITIIGLVMVVIGIGLLVMYMGARATTPDEVKPDVVVAPVPAPAPVPVEAAKPAPVLAVDEVTKGLVAQYVFRAGTPIGGDAAKRPGRDAGVVVGVVLADDPKRGHAVAAFDGQGYFTIPRPCDHDFSISFWVATKQAGGPAEGDWFNGIGLVNAEMPEIVDDFGVTLMDGRIAFGIGNPDTTIKSTIRINDGDWHHVAVVREEKSGAMAISIDGAPAGKGKGPSRPRLAPPTICIGAHSPDKGMFVGRLDDIRIYNRRLSNAEIAAIASPRGR